jgi:hypothetical protein
MKKVFPYTKDAQMTDLSKRVKLSLTRCMLFRITWIYWLNISHTNIEWCNMSRSVKYLFKYIHKGLHYVMVVLKEKGLKENQIDEIKRYIEMRYISTIEAC